MNKISIILLAFALVSLSCNHPKKTNSTPAKTSENTLQDGVWRGVLTRSDGVEIPFNFEVKHQGSLFLLRNSNQKFEGDHIRYKGDSVLISTKYFLSDFKLKLSEDGSLSGKWIQHFPKEDPVFDFRAQPHTDYRILKDPKPTAFDISGRWRVYFINPVSKDSLLAVGLLKQNDHHVTGTMVAHFHHDRFLEGVISGDSVILTSFDAAHRVKLAGAIKSNQKIVGTYYSGTDGKKKWVALKDPKVSLSNPTKITTYDPGERHLEFAFRNLKGDTISIDDKQFEDKVVLVQLMGSWCINCWEETRYLTNWYSKNKDRGVRIIALCFERSGDYAEAVKSAMTFKKGLAIPYPLLITEVPLRTPNLMEKVLPQLKNFVSFPTLIFLDRNGDIAKIHAGGMAPSDPVHQAEWIQHFNHTVDSLLHTKSGQ